MENINTDVLNKVNHSNDNFLSHLNIGTGIDISIKDLAELIAFEVGYNGEIIWDSNKPNGTHQKKLDVSLIKKLGWEYKIPLKLGPLLRRQLLYPAELRKQSLEEKVFKGRLSS